MAFCNQTRVQHHDVVFNRGSTDANVRVDLATGTDDGALFQKDIRIEHRVSTDLNAWLHIGGSRIDNCDSVLHELFQFSLTDDALELRQFDTAIDSTHF